MKKLMVVLTAAMVAVGAQAAVMNWGTGVLQDTQNGTPSFYAYAGTDVYLLYNGVGGVDPVTDVTVVGGVLQITGGTLVTSDISTGADYSAGNFLRQEAVPGLTWLGDTSATWEDMNLREFSMIAVTDDDGTLGTDGGTYYGIYSGAVSGFSTATGDSSEANFGGPLDAGQIQIVPEPATIGLMGIAGLGMFLARRKVRA